MPAPPAAMTITHTTGIVTNEFCNFDTFASALILHA
jgi:hypothetical protein